jgi:hypothetical protein
MVWTIATKVAILVRSPAPSALVAEGWALGTEGYSDRLKASVCSRGILTTFALYMQTTGHWVGAGKARAALHAANRYLPSVFYEMSRRVRRVRQKWNRGMMQKGNGEAALHRRRLGSRTRAAPRGWQSCSNSRRRQRYDCENIARREVACPPPDVWGRMSYGDRSNSGDECAVSRAG